MATYSLDRRLSEYRNEFGGPLARRTTTQMTTGGNTPPAPVPTMNTGGNTPPTPLIPVNGGQPRIPGTSLPPPISGPTPPAVRPPMQTGGNTPPSRVMPTGGNTPPLPLSMNTGGPLPPERMPGLSPLTPPGMPGFGPAPGTSPMPNIGNGGNLPALPALNRMNANDMVQQAINSLLSSDSPYMRNARQNGLDVARSRGLLNSGMAAGNSQRAAIDAALPLAQEALGIASRREGEDFSRLLTREQADLSRRNSLDLTSANARLNEWAAGNAFNRDRSMLRDQASMNNWLAGQNHVRNLAQMRDQASLNDWLSNQSYTRQFNGQLSMLPITNAFDLNRMISQYALENPEVYPPNVVSGLTNFLNQNMFSILQQYFPNMIRSGTGG